ncbi:MAG: hypothetical protein AAFO79_01185 [Pseudomonadota bacterium]
MADRILPAVDRQLHDLEMAIATWRELVETRDALGVRDPATDYLLTAIIIHARNLRLAIEGVDGQQP